MKPKIETAARENPGGYRQTDPGDPPEELVRLLSEWLPASVPATLQALRDARFGYAKR